MARRPAFSGEKDPLDVDTDDYLVQRNTTKRGGWTVNGNYIQNATVVVVAGMTVKNDFESHNISTCMLLGVTLMAPASVRRYRAMQLEKFANVSHSPSFFTSTSFNAVLEKGFTAFQSIANTLSFFSQLFHLKSIKVALGVESFDFLQRRLQLGEEIVAMFLQLFIVTAINHRH